MVLNKFFIVKQHGSSIIALVIAILITVTLCVILSSFTSQSIRGFKSIQTEQKRESLRNFIRMNWDCSQLAFDDDNCGSGEYAGVRRSNASFIINRNTRHTILSNQEVRVLCTQRKGIYEIQFYDDSGKWKALFNKGVSTCATCDGAFFKDVPIAVVGGGDSAMEEAVFLTRFASEVFVIHRRDEFRASKIMADRVMNHSKITCVWDSVVEEVLDVSADKVTGIKVKNIKESSSKVLDCGAVFIAIGHTPNTAPFSNLLEVDDNGYLLKDPGSSKTKIPGVFVAGDCSDHVYRQAITAAGMGCMAAIDAERWLESVGI